MNFGVFGDIATIRNFYAHRNADMFRRVVVKARAGGVAHPNHVDDLTLLRRAGRPFTLAEDWLGEAELFFEELMQ